MPSIIRVIGFENIVLETKNARFGTQEHHSISYIPK
jgi:hypothetical protein